MAAGYAGKKVTKTVMPAVFDTNPDSTAPGAQSWNYRFDELMPYVAFEADGADGTLGAPLAASQEQLYGLANASSDFLAPAAYRVTVPNLPDKHVLTAYHVNDPANTTENDSDAKRDLKRLDAKGDGTVTSYPQFTAANSAVQPDGSYAETTGFILLANSGTAADVSYGATSFDATPYNATFGGVAYDLANQVAKRRQVNAGVYKIPTSTVTGVVWDDTEKNENTAANGKRDEGEEGLAGQQVLLTQWYYADADVTLADGTQVQAGQWYQSDAFGSEWLTTYEVPAVVVNPGDPATKRVPVVTGGTSVADKAGNFSAVATDTYDGAVTIVYNNYTGDVLGTAATAEAGQAMADEAAAKLPEGSPVTYTVVTPDKGRYVFDNLPTAVARTDENGKDIYFLAGYKVELAQVNDTTADGSDPWHLTSLYQGTDATIDTTDAATTAGEKKTAEERALTQEESTANATDKAAAAGIAGDYRIVKRYTDVDNGNAVTQRGNNGLVIPSTVVDGATVANPLAKLDVTAGNAMDTTAAATYRWTQPLPFAEGGDVGEIAPAYAAIAGYVWCDNNYRDGAYSLTATAGDGSNPFYDPYTQTQVELEAAEAGYHDGADAKTVYLRQWYYVPNTGAGWDAAVPTTGASVMWVKADGVTTNDKALADVATAKGAWVSSPKVAGGYNSSHVNANFAYKTTTTKAENTARGTKDGYYEFTNLPVRVIVDGVEYLAGYTVAVLGNWTLMNTYVEVDHTGDYNIFNDQTYTDPEGHGGAGYYWNANYPATNQMDQWNSKARSMVRSALTGVIDSTTRYGTEVFPVRREQAASSDGNIHTLDSLLVLAGSTSADAHTLADATATQAPSQYAAGASVATSPVANGGTFDLTFAKSEKRMNAGFLEPPSAPIVGYIWEDANYDGIRQEGEYVENADGTVTLKSGERGIEGVVVKIRPLLLQPHH